MSVMFTIPKEVLYSSVYVDSIPSFCSSCKELWTNKENFTRQVMRSHLLLSYTPEETSRLLSIIETKRPFSFYRFANLLVDKTYFHLICDIVFSFQSFENLPFGIMFDQHSDFIHRKTLHGYTITCYLFSETGTTFCFEKITKEEEQFSSMIGNANSLLLQCDHSENYTLFGTSCFANKLRSYVRVTVLYKNSAEDIPLMIKKRIPIFPSPKKLYENKELLAHYEPFFRLLFNNEAVVGAYFNIAHYERFYTDALRFFYFAYYYGFVMEFAFREIQKHKNKKIAHHFEYIMRQRSRHEDSI